MGYYQNQIDKVLKGKETVYGYRIKFLHGETGESTNWMTITKKELTAIRRILKRN